MTRDETVTYVDDNVTDKTAPASLTPTDEGNAIKAVLDYIQPYKKIIFDLEISGSTATPTYTHDDFPAATKTFTIPSNGKIRLTGTGWATTNKTDVKSFIFDNGGQMYMGVPNYDLAPFYLDIDLKKYDNTQSSTPSITLRNLEIRVYP